VPAAYWIFLPGVARPILRSPGLRNMRNVVRPIGAREQVRARTHPGKVAKVAKHVRLIEVSEPGRDLRAARGTRTLDLPERRLEAANAP